MLSLHFGLIVAICALVQGKTSLTNNQFDTVKVGEQFTLFVCISSITHPPLCLRSLSDPTPSKPAKTGWDRVDGSRMSLKCATLSQTS